MSQADIEVFGLRENKEMRRVNQYRFYELATRVHPLSLVQDSSKVKDVFFDLFDARQALVEAHGEDSLRVSRPTIQSLIQAIDGIVPRDNDGSLTPEGQQLFSDDKAEIGYYHGFTLRAAVTKFEAVLSAELQSLDTYFISQKGTYSTPHLIEHAENIFPEAIRSDLPAQAVRDIQEAGRCLALDTPTAAGFHILRAIESVMAKYYHLVTGKQMPTRMRNWGGYIKRLNRSDKADTKITTFLDHIRQNYRNPITHPEVMLTPDEVEVLLGVATSAIRQMILAIQTLEVLAMLENTAPQINGSDPVGSGVDSASSETETQTPSESPSQTS